MIALLTLAAAAALSAPEPPASLTKGVFQGDVSTMEAGEGGAILYSAFIDPQGRALTCKIEQVVQIDFSDMLCASVKRVRFKPATDAQGKPTYGYYIAVMNFASAVNDKPGIGGSMRAPDLVLNVKPVPGVLTARREVAVAVSINQEGQVGDCAPSANEPVSLAVAACAQAKELWTDTVFEFPQRGGHGYVRALTVAFVPE